MVLLLNKLGYIENYGTGIQRILEAYQDKRLQPEFYVSKSYFMVTLHSLNPMNSGDAQNSTIASTNNSTIASTIRLSETQTAILSLIEKKNDITITEMSEKISKELSTIKKSIKALKEKGIVRRVGTNRLGHWEIIHKKP